MPFYFLFFLFFLVSCGRQSRDSERSVSDKPDFAQSFRIEQSENYKILKVFNPWQNAENISITYVLSDDPSLIPDSLKAFTFIRTPVKKVIALSSTHIGFISALGESPGISGISGKEFISDPLVRKAIEEKKCFDVGYAPNLNYEMILSLKPDIVFLYGLDASVQAISGRLAQTGIPSVVISEYLENHPLGKAEWIKFFASFYNKYDEAVSIFDTLKNRYIMMRDSVKLINEKPGVLSGLPWKDTWFLPGGNSFAAKLIADAGGHYLWSENESGEVIPMDLESVFMRAVDADIWINTGTAASKADLSGRDRRFILIKAYKTGLLFNNDARANTGGGNDYWESGVIHPDIILRDLIEIFHPGYLTKHDLFYYRKLE